MSESGNLREPWRVVAAAMESTATLLHLSAITTPLGDGEKIAHLNACADIYQELAAQVRDEHEAGQDLPVTVEQVRKGMDDAAAVPDQP